MSRTRVDGWWRMSGWLYGYGYVGVQVGGYTSGWIGGTVGGCTGGWMTWSTAINHPHPAINPPVHLFIHPYHPSTHPLAHTNFTL